MGNAARKARKRAGIPFVKPAKVGTPVEDRAVPTVWKKVNGLLSMVPAGRAVKRIDGWRDAAAGRSRWDKKGSKR